MIKGDGMSASCAPASAWTTRGRITCCGTVSSCQSAATSEILKRAAVSHKSDSRSSVQVLVEDARNAETVFVDNSAPHIVRFTLSTDHMHFAL